MMDSALFAGTMSGSAGFNNRGLIAAQARENILGASLEQRLERDAVPGAYADWIPAV
jgi:hypothetical protein